MLPHITTCLNVHTTLCLGAGDIKHCGSGDKTFLICHVILKKDNVFEGLCVVMPLIVSYHFPKFNGQRSFGSRDMYLICHVTLQDHVKRFCDFNEGSFSFYRTTLPSLVASHCGSEDITHLICKVTL